MQLSVHSWVQAAHGYLPANGSAPQAGRCGRIPARSNCALHDVGPAGVRSGLSFRIDDHGLQVGDASELLAFPFGALPPGFC